MSEPRSPQSPPRNAFSDLGRFHLITSLLVILLANFLAYLFNTVTLSKTESYPNDILSLTRALTSIPSQSGKEQSVFTYANSWLQNAGWTTTFQPIPPLRASLPSRQNLLAHYPNTSISNIRLLLTTHLDTVPGTGIPDNASPSATLLRGRGVVDAKGQAAGAMLAALRLSSPHVALLLVCGEETDHAGMKAAHKLGFSNGVILLNLEPTESRIATFQKGMLKGILRVKGKSAHSGYPHLGHSAVHKLLQVLPDLRRISGDGMTVNVGVIEGGSAANVVADSASATLLWRLVDEVENVRTAIMDVVRQHQNVSFDIITQNGPRKFLVPKEAKRRLGTTDVAYNTDVPYYKGETRGAVLFGAGSIRHAHTDNEIIDVEELLLLPERLMEIAREVLTDEE